MQAHGVVGPAMENYVGALIAGSAGAKLTHEETALGQKLVAELQEKLRQYQEAMQGMAEQKAELRGALARQRADQKDVFEYLKAELLKKTDEVRALERRVAELDEVNHRQLREHEERSSAAAQAAADEQEELNQVVREQKLALDKVRRFQGRQESIDAELSEQKDRLAQQSHRHHSVINDLERKHVQEKDRLKKEMLMKLRETKASLLRMTDNHLDTTTKRTIAENEQMSSELTWQSKETVKLLDKNEKLGTVNQSLRRELSIQEETLKNLSTKVHGYQKTITALLSRLNTLDASQRAELQAFQYEEEERQREKAEDQQRIEALEEDVRRLHSQVTATQEDAQFAAAKNMEAEAKHRRMLTLQVHRPAHSIRARLHITWHVQPHATSSERRGQVYPALFGRYC
mmetsp:Transcript_17045/g.55527  ORF Transcript_17045/g.55527 Transcript_17045/m.55527 type:complete len:403 (+) Transcript_17045:18-1226(+)